MNVHVQEEAGPVSHSTCRHSPGMHQHRSVSNNLNTGSKHGGEPSGSWIWQRVLGFDAKNMTEKKKN